MTRIVPVFSGAVDTTGKLHLDERSLFMAHLGTLKNKPVQVTVKAQTRRKSHGQLGYLFGVVYPVIADELGYREYEVGQVHDAVMRHLRGLKPEPNPLKMRVSLAEMSHEDVSAYIEDVRHFVLTEHGIVTPDAGKVEPRQ